MICTMERLNRKIKRIAILEARLAVLKTELQSELEQLNNSNDMTMNYVWFKNIITCTN